MTERTVSIETSGLAWRGSTDHSVQLVIDGSESG
jgi:hypothetical protein